MDDLLNKVITKFQAAPSQNLVVGISGIDGSGKSSLAKHIEEYLAQRGIPTAQISLDDLLHPKPIRHKNKDQVQGYFEDNFDYASLIGCIIDPAHKTAHFKTSYPILNLETDQITACHLEFNGPGILIIEGVFLFRKELREQFDFKIWIDIDFEDAMIRILKRSRDQRYGGVDAIRKRYETRFFPTQRFHLDRDQPANVADFIFISSHS